LSSFPPSLVQSPEHAITSARVCVSSRRDWPVLVVRKLQVDATAAGIKHAHLQATVQSPANQRHSYSRGLGNQAIGQFHHLATASHVAIQQAAASSVQSRSQTCNIRCTHLVVGLEGVCKHHMVIWQQRVACTHRLQYRVIQRMYRRTRQKSTVQGSSGVRAAAGSTADDTRWLLISIMSACC
jgi:hypothetical protein